VTRGIPTRTDGKPLAAVLASVLIVASFFFANDAFAQRTDTFNAAQTFQTIDHFGSHDSWTGQVYGGWAPENRQAITDALFSTETGIGLSGWYYNLAAGVDPSIASRNYPWRLRTQESFETGQGTYDWSRNAANGLLLADAKAHGVDKFMMTVYSPPLRMTDNGKPYPDSPGGNNLKTGYEQQFATYIVDVLEHFKNNPNESERIDFDYISPLNEPQYNWSGGGQEGNGRLSATEIRNQVNALHNELTARGLTTGIRAPEAGSIQSLVSGENYLNQLARNNSVNTKLGQTITYHSYFSDNDANMLPMRQQLAAQMATLPGWDVWQTEYGILGNNASSGQVGNGNDFSMNPALAIARTIHFDLTVANASAWSTWLAAAPIEHNYKEFIYFDNANQTFEVAKSGWALGHYARFIRPGAERIEFEGANNDIEGVLASGWRDATTNELTLVYANQLNANEVVNHDFRNAGSFKSDYLTPFVTTDAVGMNLAEQTPFLVGQNYTLPARSMVTMVSGTFNENNDGKVFPSIYGDRDYVLGSGMLTLADGNGIYSGSMSGAGGFVKQGAGEMVLTNNNTYSGQTIVEEGTMVLGGTTNSVAGRIGRDSELVIRGSGTVRVDHFNAIGGFGVANNPDVRIETGGSMTISNGYSANLGAVTLAGGELAGETPDVRFGNWTINRGILVTGNTLSTITAPSIQLRGEQSIDVESGSTLRITGAMDDFFGADSSTLLKTGNGVLEIARSSIDQVQLLNGRTKLIASGAQSVMASSAPAMITKSLDIGASSTFDLNDDMVLIDYSGETPMAEMMASVVDGRLMTSVPDQMVAIVEAADLGLSSIGGVTLDDSALLMQLAAGGDYNLDAEVNSLDVEILIANYCQPGNGWISGDTDYDGMVGFSDMVTMLGNYVGPGIEAYEADQKFIDDWNRVVGVPEPSNLILLFGAGAIALSRRRRIAAKRLNVE